MVVHHWSDDGMVMYHRRSLIQGRGQRPFKNRPNGRGSIFLFGRFSVREDLEDLEDLEASQDRTN